MKVSKTAEHIIGSEIIKIAADVNEKIKAGKKIYNLTIGDFNPNEFPIPEKLKELIIDEYKNHQTNYPPADGLPELRKAVSELLKERCHLHFSSEEILIAAGARPVIYSIFRTLVDPGDKVIFATPSWNNNHYSYLNNAVQVLIEAKPENNFMPSAKDIFPHIQDASLIALCSPQNPTGTVITKESLTEICEMILNENKRRSAEQKPLYLMYDQIYWALTYGNIEHVNPVTLCPEMKNYTVFVDGISKSLAATGVRVGWGMGPKFIIDKMKAILTHIGAWAPKPEQIATAKYLSDLKSYDDFISHQKEKISFRLNAFFAGFQKLKSEGYAVDAISPQAAIYLTVRFSLHGKKTSDGKILATTSVITSFLLNKANLALVPFYAFGTSDSSDWYRLSVGACKAAEIENIISDLRNALSQLS